ncbi:MAG: hypothetical protein MUQ51_02125 [Pseudomonadota bacterium]|nr:hypothetical protein [Pseudomonadota bacterium]MDO7710408.1 hypothetical protein [Pseudomonadota bacterium]
MVELLIVVVISVILMAGMQSLIGTTLKIEADMSERNDSLQQARFAMQTMVVAVSGTQRLLIPLAENPSTPWSESVRDVLAVTLGPQIDRNQDGWADANNDKDYLDINNNGARDVGEPERINEDLDDDNTNDGRPGIINIDDDGDGLIDEGSSNDDDEDDQQNEDPQDGIDNDGDGSIDEDASNDLSNDRMPGNLGVDDDLDGLIDEGGSWRRADDDEDSARDEDWLDPIVFYLNGTTLMQRIPNIDPADGADYSEYPIAENVTQLQIERLLGNDGVTVLVDITLQISPSTIEAMLFNTRVRVGARL